jgi:hypothetical protein
MIHHITSIFIMYFTWNLNLHRIGTVVIFFNSIVQVILLMAHRICKLLKLKKSIFWSFWMYFLTKLICLFIFVKMSYNCVFNNPIFADVPYSPTFFLITAFGALLIIIFVYYAMITYRKSPNWPYHDKNK